MCTEHFLISGEKNWIIKLVTKFHIGFMNFYVTFPSYLIEAVIVKCVIVESNAIYMYEQTGDNIGRYLAN